MANPKIKVDIEANVSGQPNVEELSRAVNGLATTLDGDLKVQAVAAGEALKTALAAKGALADVQAMRESVKSAASALSAANREAIDYGQTMRAVGVPTAAMAAKERELAEAVNRARSVLVGKNATLQGSQQQLLKYGFTADNAAVANRRIAETIAGVEQKVKSLDPAYARLGQQSAASASQQTQSAKKVESGLESLKGQLSTLRNIAVAAMGGSYLGSLAKDVAATADEYKNLQARIKLVTGEGAAFESAFEGVTAVAQRTSSNLESTGNLFTKLAEAGRSAGLGTQAAITQALALTETVNQAVQLSGASAESAKAGVTQLIQALQSGVLRGDEFNSIMENSPRLAKALSEGLGVTTGELRKMAEAGQLSSETVIKALQGQADVVAGEFSKLPATVGRAIENLSSSWTLYVGETDKAMGASSAAASAINVVAENLDKIARVAALAGLALTASLAVQGAAAFRVYAAEALLATGATNLLTASIDKIPKGVNIALAVTGFEVGYEIGTWLRENTVWARKLGEGLVAYARAAVSSLQFIKESATAVFTNDTLDASMERFQKRNAAIRDDAVGAMREAEKAPQRIGSAVDLAAAKTGALGSVAQSTGSSFAAAGAAGASGVGQIGKAAEDSLGVFQKLLAEASKPAPKNGAIDGIAKALIDAKAKGLNLTALLEKELPAALDKLSGPELAKFRQDFGKAMQEGGARGAELQTGLRLIGEQAAKSLGVDVVEASNKIGDSFKDADEQMRLLILSLPALKAAGVDTGEVVAQAFSKMIDGAKNKAEVDAVIVRIEALRKVLGDKVADGLLDQATQKATALKEAMDKAKPGINSVAEAMKLLGVVSDQSLKDVATKSKTAFEAMRDSGKSSARELSDGFKKYATDAIAANGGVATETIKAQAAMYGLKVEVDSTGKAIVKSMNEGSDALRDHKGNVIETMGAYQKLKAAAYEATSAIGKMRAAEASAMRKDGQHLAGAWLEDQAKWADEMADFQKNSSNPEFKAIKGSGGGPQATERNLFDWAKNAGLDEADALRLAQNAFPGWNDSMNRKPMDVGTSGGSGPLIKIPSAAEKFNKEINDLLSKRINERSTVNPVGNPSNAPSSATTYVSNITIPGIGTTKLTFADASSQSAGEDLLRKLAQAKSSSGY